MIIAVVKILMALLRWSSHAGCGARVERTKDDANAFSAGQGVDQSGNTQAASIASFATGVLATAVTAGQAMTPSV